MLNRNYYKANKSNTGASVSVNYGVDDKGYDGFFMIRINRQNGWNEQNQTGSFRDGESVCVKMSMFEAAQIKSAIDYRSDKFSFYHDGGPAKTKGSVSYYKLEDKNNAGKFFEGYSIQISKKTETESVFKTSLSLAEAADLSAYIAWAQGRVFTLLEEASEQRFANRVANGGNTANTTNSKPSPAKTTPQPTRPAAKTSTKAKVEQQEAPPEGAAEYQNQTETEDVPF
jgi:hypothetical protein